MNYEVLFYGYLIIAYIYTLYEMFTYREQLKKISKETSMRLMVFSTLVIFFLSPLWVWITIIRRSFIGNTEEV
jgi:hypothetical protein